MLCPPYCRLAMAKKCGATLGNGSGGIGNPDSTESANNEPDSRPRAANMRSSLSRFAFKIGLFRPEFIKLGALGSTASTAASAQVRLASGLLKMRQLAASTPTILPP